MVRSPVAGEVVEVRPSRGNTGQIFGGVVKIQDADGRVFVCRHVEPRVDEGEKLLAGTTIATVTNWRDGSDHVHLEVWRSLRGGYHLENMIDPGTLEWEPYGAFHLPDGNTLRLTLGANSWAGWGECGGPLRWVAAHGVDPKQERAAIAWRGEVWRGPADVTNVCKSLVKRFLTEED